MPVDDFEAAYDAAVAADEAGTIETATDFGRNAKVWDGEEQVTETDDVEVSQETETASSEVDDEDVDPVSSETASEAFDWSAHKDELVTLKVDGQDITVPLAEAMSSYMRQSDYTRKTQALAEERKLAEWGREFQTAIRNDPAGTIKALQDALGMEEQADPYADLDPELQPMATQLKAQQAQIDQFNRMMEAQQQAVVLEQVKAEVASVKNRFPDFDATKVLPLAAERGLSVEEAYKLIKADEFLNERANAVKAQASAAEKAKVAAAKRAAAEQVSRGGSSSGSAAGSADSKSFDSFEELLNFNLQSSS